MNKSNLKPASIFIIIVVVLTALILMGIRIAKNRETSMQNQSTPVATTSPPSTQPEQTPPAQSAPSRPSESAPPQITTSPSPHQTSSPSSSETPSQVPSTGPSILDISLTGLALGFATYFMLKLRQSRAMYRRLLSSR